MGILSGRKQTLAAAESCTGGLAAELITGIPGASKVFWGCFVTYTIDAKVRMLGVSEALLDSYGAVSQPTALAMAEEALKKSDASWAFSITGLAGPLGDSKEPVGTVWIGIAERGSTVQKDPQTGAPISLRSEAKKFFFTGSRNEVREAAAAAALEELLKQFKS